MEMSHGRVFLTDLVSRHTGWLKQDGKEVRVLAQLVCDRREMATDNFGLFSFLFKYTICSHLLPTANPGEEEGRVQYKLQTHCVLAEIDQMAGEEE